MSLPSHDFASGAVVLARSSLPALVLLVSLHPVAAQQLVISTPDLTASPGDQLRVPVMLSEGSGVGTLTFFLGYDDTVLSVPTTAEPCGGRVAPGSLVTGAHTFLASCTMEDQVIVSIGCPSVTCPSLDSGSGTLAEITFDVTQSAAGSCGLSFDAVQANGTDGSLLGVIPQNGACTIGSAGADLSVSKQVSPDPIIAGRDVLFDLTVTNAGFGQADGVQLVDPLPAGLRFRPDSSSSFCSQTEGSVTCELGSLAAGAAALAAITATPELPADLAIALFEVSPSTPTVVGDLLNYVIEVANFGPSDANDVFVQTLATEFDLMTGTPIGAPPLDLVSVSPSQGACALIAGSVECRVGTLARGSRARIVLRTRPTTATSVPGAPGTLQNSVRVSRDGLQDSAGFDPDSANNQGQLETVVLGPANSLDLAVSRFEVNPAVPVPVGTNLTYDIEVSNFGTQAGNPILHTLTSALDPVTGLPTGPSLPVTLVSSATTQGACSQAGAGSPLECQLGRLGVGERASVQVTVTATAPSGTVGAPGSLTNAAGVLEAGALTGPDPEANPSNDQQTIDSVILPSTGADLSIMRLEAMPDVPVVAGEELTYSIEVVNFGPQAEDAVLNTLASSFDGGGNSISPPLPVQIVSSSASRGSCQDIGGAGAGPIRCDLGMLADGGSASVTVVVVPTEPINSEDPAVIFTNAAQVISVSAASGGGSNDPNPGNDLAELDTAVNPEAVRELSNTATVSTQSMESNTANNESSVEALVENLSLPNADLSLAMAGPASANAGGSLLYSLTATNLGPSSAFQVVAEVQLPPGLTFQGSSSSPSCSPTAGGVRCEPGDLAAGASVTVSILTQVAQNLAGSVLVSTSNVGGGVQDPNPANNLAFLETLIEAPVADVSLTKTAIPTTITAGDRITYSFQVTNAGPMDAQDTMVTDALPTGATLDVGLSSPNCFAVSGTVNCPLGTVPAGESRSTAIVVNTAVSVTGLLENMASVTTSAGDSNLSDNQASVTVDVESPPMQTTSAGRLAVVGTIEIPDRRSPAGLAVLPDGNLLILLREQGETGPGGVALVDFGSDPPTVRNVILPEPGSPGGIAVDPEGRRAYVAVSRSIGSLTTEGRNRVDVLNVEQNPPTFVTSIEAASASSFGPIRTAVGSGGSRVFVSNRGNNVMEILEVDPEAGQYLLSDSVPVPGDPIGIAYKDGLVYVAGRVNRQVSLIDPQQDPPQVIANIELTIGPSGSLTDIVCSDSRPRCFVVYAGGEAQVAVIDTAARDQVSEIDLRARDLTLTHVSLSADDGALFVLGRDADSRSAVLVIDLTGDSFDQRIAVGRAGADVAFAGGDEAILFAASQNDRSVSVLGFEGAPFVPPVPGETLLTDVVDDSNRNGSPDPGIDRRLLFFREGNSIFGFRGEIPQRVVEMFLSDPHPISGRYQTFVLNIPAAAVSQASSRESAGIWKRVKETAAETLGISEPFTITVNTEGYDAGLRPRSLLLETQMANGMSMRGRIETRDSDGDGVTDVIDVNAIEFLPSAPVTPTMHDLTGDGAADYVGLPYTLEGVSAYLPLSDTNGDGVPDTVGLDFDRNGKPDPDLPLMPLFAGPPPGPAEIPLHFAQFGDGSLGEFNIFSQILLFNLDSDSQANVRLSFRDDQGDPLTVDLNGAVVVGEEEVVVPPGGLRVLRTDGEGPLTVGSVSAVADRAVGGVVVFGGSVGVAGVGVSHVQSGGFVAAIETSAEEGINTGMAVMNVEAEPATLVLSLRDLDGRLLATGQLQLAGHGHRALFVDEIIWTEVPGVPLDFADFAGIVTAATPGRVAATVIQTRPGEFATQPVAPNFSALLGADASQAEERVRSVGAEPRAEQRLYFAQFGDGVAGGAQLFSQIMLFNLSQETANVQLELRDSSGAPLTVDLDGEQITGETSLVIPARGLRVPATDGAGEAQTGWVTVRSDQALAGVIVFGGTAGVAGVGSSSRLLSGFEAPMETSRVDRINTGIAVANLGEVRVTLSLTLCDREGFRLATAETELPAQGHRARFLDQFPWQPEEGVVLDFSGFEGILKVETSGPVAATVIQTRPGVFATLPVVPGLD